MHVLTQDQARAVPFTHHATQQRTRWKRALTGALVTLALAGHVPVTYADGHLIPFILGPPEKNNVNVCVCWDDGVNYHAVGRIKVGQRDGSDGSRLFVECEVPVFDREGKQILAEELCEEWAVLGQAKTKGGPLKNTGGHR